MKKREVDSFLNKGFTGALKKYKPKKDKKRYLFVFGDIYLHFGYGVVDSDNSFPTTFSYKIGCRQLYQILSKVFPDRYNEKNKFPLAIGTGQIALFDEGKYPVLEYDIYTEQDAQKMVDEVSDYILNSVLPPWEENPTIEYLEKQVNSEVKDVPNFSGLILAKMVDNPCFELIKKTLVGFSNNWSEFDKKDLIAVIEFLDVHSAEEIMRIGNQ